MKGAIPLVVLLALLSGCGADAPPGANLADSGEQAAPAGAPGCASLPDFIRLDGDARPSLCTSGAGAKAGHESGTVIYTTGQTPGEVIAFYRRQAEAAGLEERVSTEGANPMYSAEDGTRSMMVLTELEEDGARVTVNWGRNR